MSVHAVKTYKINDLFYSLQGEGLRAGTANLFLRFAGCDQTCQLLTHGFDCDTEFVSQQPMTAEQIVERCQELSPTCRWMICTGGEPALQLDTPLVDALHAAGYQLAIETNGAHNVDPLHLDWICVSPKVAEHALQQLTANEVKYVRAYGHGIPKTRVQAAHYVISPAFDGERLDPKTLGWCLQLCREHPAWRLSLQIHKLLGVR